MKTDNLIRVYMAASENGYILSILMNSKKSRRGDKNG